LDVSGFLSARTVRAYAPRDSFEFVLDCAAAPTLTAATNIPAIIKFTIKSRFIVSPLRRSKKTNSGFINI
jgi:hypothetical protein